MKFCEEGSNEVFVADEWDRSPAEVTPRLNYQSVFFSIICFVDLFCSMGSWAFAASVETCGRIIVRTPFVRSLSYVVCHSV